MYYFTATFPTGGTVPMQLLKAVPPTTDKAKATQHTFTTSFFEPWKEGAEFSHKYLYEIIGNMYEIYKDKPPPEDAVGGTGTLTSQDGLQIWNFTGLWPQWFGFGELDYNSSGDITIEVIWHFEECKYTEVNGSKKMGATTLAKKWRDNHWQYLSGNGIDIGHGGDLLETPCGKVMGWEGANGDARIMEGVADAYFDFVYSSHCLEHLMNVEDGLYNWIRILKPGGHLFLILPDWKLYEHCMWPSIFNRTHKFTFSIDVTRQQLGRLNHYNIEKNIVPLLQDIEIIEIKLEDYNIDYDRLLKEPFYDQSFHALAQILIIGKKIT